MLGFNESLKTGDFPIIMCYISVRNIRSLLIYLWLGDLVELVENFLPDLLSQNLPLNDSLDNILYDA